VLAPLLGVIGAAPAFAAIAGLAGTAWRRAGLAAAGVVWLVAAETLGAGRLLFGSPGDVQPRGAWEDSAAAAGHHAIAPVLTSPALAPAVVFAFFAVALPVVVRGRALWLDAIGAAVWAGGLAGSLNGLPRLFPSLGQPNGAVAGALLGAALVVAAGEAGLVPRSGRRPDLP
jgi:hypothetical protein